MAPLDPRNWVPSMRSFLTQHDVDQLKALYSELPGASWKAVNRLRILSPASVLEGGELERFREAHERVAQILAKMTKILGE